MTPAEERLAAIQQLSALLGRAPSTAETQRLADLLRQASFLGTYPAGLFQHPDFYRSAPPTTATTFSSAQMDPILRQQRDLLSQQMRGTPPLYVSRGTTGSSAPHPYYPPDPPTLAERAISYSQSMWVNVSHFMRRLLDRLPEVLVERMPHQPAGKYVYGQRSKHRWTVWYLWRPETA